MLAARPQSAADRRADLLTTVMHELGHELGYADDDAGDLMNATLPLGVRLAKLPCGLLPKSDPRVTRVRASS